MRTERQPAPARDDDAADAAAATAPTRRPNGRWVEGHCPNPKGRPPKAKAQPHDVLQRLLDEVLPKGGPGGGLTMREAVLKALCGHAVKNPRVALELIKRGLLDCPDAGEGEAAGLEADEDAQLDAFLARQMRRKRTGGNGEDAP